MKGSSFYTLVFSFFLALMVLCGPIGPPSTTISTENSSISVSNITQSTSFRTLSPASTNSTKNSTDLSSSNHTASSTWSTTSSFLSRRPSSTNSNTGATTSTGGQSEFSILTKSYGASNDTRYSTNATAKATAFPSHTPVINSSSSFISSDLRNASARSTIPPVAGSATSSALYTLSTFAGPQNGSAPPWNLNNVSCHEMDFLDGAQQWAAVNGDSVVETFSQMYSGNQLMCSECFGRDKKACTSTDLTCQRGLTDLAAIANTTGQARWDTAAAIFAQDPDDSDLMCDIGTSECTGSPKCELLDGPGAWAIVKSIETMYNQLDNVYNSILAAGDAAGHQMQAFSSTFAPVPDFKDSATWLMVMVAIIGAVLGAITAGWLAPLAVSAVAATEGAAVAGAAGAAEGAAVAGSTVPLVVSTAVGGATGVGSAVGVNTFFFGMPQPGDTDSPLGTIISATLLTWSNFCDKLMSDGSYVFTGNNGVPPATISLQNLMKNGSLMQANNNVSQGFVALEPVMELIMFQQLALYTWNNLQTSDVSLTPYIVYDNTPCDKLNITYEPNYWGGSTRVFGSDSILSYIPEAYTLDNNMTDNGKCYWLLGAKPDGSRVFGKKVAPSFHCEGGRALPGATNKELSQNSGIFASLGLKHWIIPSVLGWLQNHNQNGYQMATQLGQLVSDPLQPATVNIPVCEYIRNKDNPGVGCPKLGQHQTGSCEVYAPSTGVNQPGAYNPGQCAAHVDQYQRREPDNVNPLSVYQLAISITDANGIEVGQASKQSAAHALEVVDSALPYDLIVNPGAGDFDPDKFWYSDQYWNSTKCNVTSYDGGKRHMDCFFNCPFPNATAPTSATIANPVPGVATAAIGDIKYSNTYTSIAPSSTSTSTGPPPPPPSPAYATGQCSIYVIQYQKTEVGENPSNNYLIEAYLFDAKKNVIGQSGQVAAPMGVPVNVPGLVSAFTITANATDDQSLVCGFRGKKITLDKATCGKHSIGKYNNGVRDIDCKFAC